jgi:hypothetical protein
VKKYPNNENGKILGPPNSTLKKTVEGRAGNRQLYTFSGVFVSNPFKAWSG